jgi:surface polysaccharide O-acyltransferase-like enzyme
MMAVWVVALDSGFAAGSESMFGDLAIQELFRLAVPFFFLADGFFFITRRLTVTKLGSCIDC